MTHRRDIDGLRAIAVLGVMLAHAGFGFVPAGHAGVDVFFAISGYLIGGIIAQDLSLERFSFRVFYMRRARRILPALLVMLLATLPLAWWLMTPHQLRYFGGGAFATLLFLSNVWFFNRIDYFNPETANDPLVHTWSLGVEEQFYIAVPMLMVAVWRFGRHSLLSLILILAGLSVALALMAVSDRPTAAFYLPQFRAWELFLGVAAALAQPRIRAAVPARFGRGLAAIGLLAILGSLTLIPSDAAWPGPATIVPVTGTLLVLLFGAPSGPASKLLGSAPLVGIGLISYSAYLWHQPVLGFLRISGHPPEGVGAKLFAVSAALALAWASWRWVEQPFRNRRVPAARARWLAAGAFAAITAVAIGGHITKGYPGRMSAEVLAMLEHARSWPPTYRSCIGGRDEDEWLDPAKACIHGADLPARVAIWGDSHAAVLAGPLGDALLSAGLSVRELTVGSCIPIGRLKNSALKRTEYCADHNAKMLDYLVTTPEIEVVVMNAFWNSYTERRDFDTGIGWVTTDAVIALPLDETPDMDEGRRLAFMAETLRAEVARLTDAGKDVILLYPLPQAGFDPPEELARRLWRGETLPRTLSYPAAAFDDYSRLSRALLDQAGDGPRVHRLDLSAAFCTRGAFCNVVEDGTPLLFNENHLSLAGTAKIVPAIAEMIRATLATRQAQGD